MHDRSRMNIDHCIPTMPGRTEGERGAEKSLLSDPGSELRLGRSRRNKGEETKWDAKKD